MKKYIVYRHYNNMLLGWSYERIELTKEELLKYLDKHLSEIKEIEIFKRDEKSQIDISISIK